MSSISLDRPEKQSGNQIERLLRDIAQEQDAADRRSDDRVPISIVVAVVPCFDGRPQPQLAFPTFTKNISAEGASLVLYKPVQTNELLLGLPGKRELSYLRAWVLRREPMALGCERVGLRIGEIVTLADYPELAQIDCYDPAAQPRNK